MGRRIYVGNLPFSATEKDLRDTFSTVGNLVFARLMTDRETGQSRGFAFIEFSTDDEHQRAIAELNGYDLGGRRLVVNEARDKADRPPTFNTSGGYNASPPRGAVVAPPAQEEAYRPRRRTNSRRTRDDDSGY